MELIAHRGLWSENVAPNSLPAFASALHAGLGIETDVRSFAGELYLSHDPISHRREGVTLEDLFSLAHDFPRQTLFLNIKEDGLLPLLLHNRTAIARLKVVFFDMSVPQLVQYAKHLPAEVLATRLSDKEPFPSCLDKCSWIWLDAFEKDWQASELKQIKSAYKKKLAIVSPELHHRDPSGLWQSLRSVPDLINEDNALCTDQPVSFQQELSK